MPQQVSETAQLAFGNLTNTFTGSDITAVIIRRDDQILLKKAIEYLAALEDYINNAQQNDPNVVLGFQSNPIETVRDFDSPTPYDAKTLYPVINMQSFTISTYRNKTQVRSLGHINPRGIARGTRTLAGTMILTEFDRDPFWQLIGLSRDPVPAQDYNIGDTGKAVLPDQLAPFDLLLLFANEAGSLAYRMAYELELVTNGSVYSIQDMYHENTLSFLATDITPLTPLPPVVVRDGLLMSEALVVGPGKTVRLSPLAAVSSGKEVLRRYRLLKNSRRNTF